mmetsp:Transcript_29503/g.51818  ORF Transcript_29503/g.51818 Transcript_29503/m.51818 type:complete len:213 (-) Transcript_29503:209-847(-)
MSESGGKVEAVDNIGRRKWDMAVYDKKQKDFLDQQEKEILGGADAERRLTLPVKREPLKRRTQEVDLVKTVGKRMVVASSAALAEQGGYYCDVCECLLKDSSTYLSHINGRRHQRRLGMSMRAERATLTEVRDRLAHHKRKRDEEEDKVASIEQRMSKMEAELKKEKKKKKKKKKEAEAAASGEGDEGLTEEQKMMKAMGFDVSFGGSKKNT